MNNNLQTHRIIKLKDMQGSSIQNLLAQPDVDNKSKVNKQKVMTKRQDLINSRIHELTNADVEVIARPANEWRKPTAGSMAANNNNIPTQETPTHYKERYPDWWPQSLSHSLAEHPETINNNYIEYDQQDYEINLNKVKDKKVSNNKNKNKVNKETERDRIMAEKTIDNKKNAKNVRIESGRMQRVEDEQNLDH